MGLTGFNLARRAAAAANAAAPTVCPMPGLPLQQDDLVAAKPKRSRRPAAATTPVEEPSPTDG